MDAKNMSLDELIKRDKQLKRGGARGRGGRLDRGGRQNRGGRPSRGQGSFKPRGDRPLGPRRGGFRRDSRD